MTWQVVVLLALAATVLLAVLDRLLLAAEARGWIYYRRRKPESGSLSNAAFGPVFDVLQPSRQVTTQEQQHQRLARHDAGNEDENDGRPEPR